MGMITPRLSEKLHGTGVKIGRLLESDTESKVVVVGDLITHVDSKLEAIEELKK